MTQAFISAFRIYIFMRDIIFLKVLVNNLIPHFPFQLKQLGNNKIILSKFQYYVKMKSQIKE